MYTDEGNWDIGVCRLDLTCVGASASVADGILTVGNNMPVFFIQE